MMKYDKNTGDIPNIGDRVETCHFGDHSDMLGIKYVGIFSGWAISDKTIGVMILDKPNELNGELTICAPVVCIKKIEIDHREFGRKHGELSISGGSILPQTKSFLYGERIMGSCGSTGC